ncbi:MAG: aminotransferase class I/II-fold pyridoxal phosphate-dependent enzyme, partial [Candidatus Bathyarchaeota archaeon]
AYRTIEEEHWKPDIEDIKSKISQRTKALLLINPNNPCGAMYDRNIVKKIIDLAAENDLLILSDEIYDQIVYDGRFLSTARIAKSFPVIGLNGLSKAYLMTGWRLGYLYFKDPDGELQMLIESIKKESRIRLCTNTPVQKAGVAALTGKQDHLDDMVRKLRKRRDYAWKRLNEIEGIRCTKPRGAFYVFPKIDGIGERWKTDFEFVLDVLQKIGVLFVHGSGFCENYGAGHVRGVFLPPVKILEKAFDLLDSFMKND